jgi:hypothetical protein
MQPHCNFPNNSSQFRMVQYIKMFPARDENNTKYDDFVLKRRALMDQLTKYHINNDIDKLELDELGRKLLGLKSWFK